MDASQLEEIAAPALEPEFELERVIVTRDRVARAGAAESALDTSTTITVIALCEGHAGAASLPASGGEKALDEAVELAHERAEWKAENNGDGPLDDRLPLFEGQPHSGFDPHTATVEPGVLSGLAAAACSEHPGTTVSITAAALEMLVANPDGGRLTDSRTVSMVRATTMSSGICSFASPTLATLDAGLCARMAFMHGEYALPAIEPATLPAVIGAEALAAILDFVCSDLIAENPGGITRGQAIAAPVVSVADSPRLGGTLQRSLDAEGTPVSDVALIDRGNASDLANDLLTAGGSPTGHSRSPFALWQPPGPSNLVMDGGEAPDERHLAGDLDCLLIPAIKSLSREPDGTVCAITAASERKVAGEIMFIGPLEIALPRFGGLETITALTSRRDLHATGRSDNPREWRSVLCPSALMASVNLRNEA